MQDESSDRRAIERPGSDRRRAPRPQRLATDLLTQGAAPATTTELARWVGCSSQKILLDVAAGELRAADKPRRSGSTVLFPVPEALRYLRQMGVVVDAPSA